MYANLDVAATTVRTIRMAMLGADVPPPAAMLEVARRHVDLMSVLDDHRVDVPQRYAARSARRRGACGWTIARGCSPIRTLLSTLPRLAVRYFAAAMSPDPYFLIARWSLYVHLDELRIRQALHHLEGGHAMIAVNQADAIRFLHRNQSMRKLAVVLDINPGTRDALFGVLVGLS
jgi:hypothetical protein